MKRRDLLQAAALLVAAESLGAGAVAASLAARGPGRLRVEITPTAGCLILRVDPERHDELVDALMEAGWPGSVQAVADGDVGARAYARYWDDCRLRPLVLSREPALDARAVPSYGVINVHGGFLKQERMEEFLKRCEVRWSSTVVV